MKRHIHILALFLFALTQCFAPLVHAHADGMQDNSSFHTHGILNHLAPTSIAQCSAESCDSPVISIPHEYHRDDAYAILNVFSSATHPCSVSLAKGSVNLYRLGRPTTLSYHKPHTQAPPAWI